MPNPLQQPLGQQPLSDLEVGLHTTHQAQLAPLLWQREMHHPRKCTLAPCGIPLLVAKRSQTWMTNPLNPLLLDGHRP